MRDRTGRISASARPLRSAATSRNEIHRRERAWGRSSLSRRVLSRLNNFASVPEPRYAPPGSIKPSRWRPSVRAADPVRGETAARLNLAPRRGFGHCERTGRRSCQLEKRLGGSPRPGTGGVRGGKASSARAGKIKDSASTPPPE